MDSALCAQVGGEEFFPEYGESTQAAKTVCAVCPVREACLGYALATNQTIGVWGGLTVVERRALKRRAAA